MNRLNPLLRLEELELSFSREPSAGAVIHTVNLTADSSEVLALVGESGCGKSSTALAIAGLLPEAARITKGTLWLAGKEFDLKNSSTPDSREVRRVALVPQEALSTLHPIFKIGTQLARVYKRESRERIVFEHCRALLGDLGFARPEAVLRSRAEQLSGGMRQRISIALALLAPADLIIADEPTTALDPILDRLVMGKILGHIRGTGKTLLWISHDIHRVSELADRIAVMFQGRIVAEGSPSDVMRPHVHPYVDKLLKSNVLLLRRTAKSMIANSAQVEKPEVVPENGPSLLEANNVTKYFFSAGPKMAVHALEGIKITIGRGEILSIVGGSGSGKTTLALCLAGLLKPTYGTVEFDGQNINTIPARLLRRHLQILFQDPFTALDPKMTVEELIGEPLAIHRVGSAAARLRKVMDILDHVYLPMTTLQRKTGEISAGQRQRVALGRALALNPWLLICDEPLVSLDSVAQFELLSILVHLQLELGLSLIFITHDFRVACSISQRVSVLENGSFVDSGNLNDLLSAPRHPWTKELIATTKLDRSFYHL